MSDPHSTGSRNRTIATMLAASEHLLSWSCETRGTRYLDMPQRTSSITTPLARIVASHTAIGTHLARGNGNIFPTIRHSAITQKLTPEFERRKTIQGL